MGEPETPEGADFASPIATSSVVDTLTKRIETAIVTGQLPAGSRLSEQALATLFGVSRGPLREALRSLEGRGLIERKHNIGARVASLSANDLEELLVVRDALEGAAARLAAERMSAEDIAELVKVAESDAQGGTVTTPDISSVFESNGDRDFHLMIIRGSRNERLIRLLTGDMFYLFRIYRLRSSVRAGRSVQAALEHRSIASAIAARDPEGAEKAMRHHLNKSYESMLLDLPEPAENAGGSKTAALFEDGRRSRWKQQTKR